MHHAVLCTLIFVRDQIKSQRPNSQQLSHYISDVHGQKDRGQATIKLVLGDTEN